MKSHQYQCTLADAGKLLAEWILPLIGLAVLLRLGAASGILPVPWPSYGVDETILVHQANASRTRSGAHLILLGDSSCLTDVSGSRLEEAFGGTHRVLNLGAFSYLGLNGFATLLSRHSEANPKTIRSVVVLLHPEMLRGIAPVSHYLVLLSDFYAGVDFGDTRTLRGQLSGLFGADVVWNRLLGRIPLPLPGAWGHEYGFNRDLDRFMKDHRGTVLDPNRYRSRPGQGNAEYRLAARWETECRALRAVVPPAAQLFLGITPIPATFAPEGFEAERQRMLAQWGAWMQADALLTELPATLPDTRFASITHLNATGNREYSDLLAACLRSRLPAIRRTEIF